ncbi:MAG: tol-pal system protein YbgF [Alphaproteobacteria bacterium]
MTIARLPLPDTAPLRSGAAALVMAAGLALAPTSAVAGAAVLGIGAAGDAARLPSPPDILAIQAQRDPSARAREQAYIAGLEEEIRRLTGRIEQLEHQQRTIDGRFDQLVEDLDQRLRVLEEGGAAGLAAGAEVGNGRRQAEQALNDLASGSVQGQAQGQAAEEGQLGSVPESAIAGLPRPDPAAVAAPEKSTLTPEQQYENAVQLLQAGDYQGAQGGLEVFLDMHPDHQLAANAAYWLAETHYVRQNYSAAAAAFARNYRTYGKDSSKSIDNLLKLGMSLANLGEKDKACLSYDELTSAFPQRPAHIEQALSRERARAECS